MKAWPVNRDASAFADGDMIIRIGSRFVNRFLDDLKKIADAYGMQAELVLLQDAPFSAAAQINSGIKIGIGTTLIDAAKGDADLFAFVVAHELAHVQHGDIGCSGHAAEFGADKTAVEIMQKAGFHPNGAIRFFELFPCDESETHPSTRARIEALAHLQSGT